MELIDPKTGANVNLPAGVYGVTVAILKTVTTAIRVERF